MSNNTVEIVAIFNNIQCHTYEQRFYSHCTVFMKYHIYVVLVMKSGIIAPCIRIIPNGNLSSYPLYSRITTNRSCDVYVNYAELEIICIHRLGARDSSDCSNDCSDCSNDRNCSNCNSNGIIRSRVNEVNMIVSGLKYRDRDNILIVFYDSILKDNNSYGFNILVDKYGVTLNDKYLIVDGTINIRAFIRFNK